MSVHKESLEILARLDPLVPSGQKALPDQLVLLAPQDQPARMALLDRKDHKDNRASLDRQGRLAQRVPVVQ